MGKVVHLSGKIAHSYSTKNTGSNYHSPFHAGKEQSNNINADRRDERLVVSHLDDIYSAEALESNVFSCVGI